VVPILIVREKEIKCKLIVFDLDGTLADQFPSFVLRARARSEAIRQYANKKAAVLWEKIAGVNLKLCEIDQEGPLATLPIKEEMLVGALCFYLAGYEWEEARQLVQLAYKTAEKSLIPPFGLVLFPSVREMLIRLKNHGFRLAVASSNGHNKIEDALNALGIGLFFDSIVGADDVVNGKPSPDMLEEIMKQTKTWPHETLIVGDSTYDMEMGRNAKLKACIGVLTGSCKRNKLEPLSDVVINSVTELNTH
jgi:phosphoglycolate phosphatase